MRTLPFAAVFACAITVIAAVARAQDGAGSTEPRLLRLGVFAPERHVHVETALIPWMERVNRDLARDGVEIRLFSGGALGRKGEFQYRLLETGVHDLSWFPTGYMPGRFPALELFEIPLLTDDPVALTRAFWRLYERGKLPGFDGLEALALSVSPAYNFHLTFPVDSLADLKGRKIRVLNAVQAEMMEGLGATPVAGIGGSEVAESLSRGLIDGALFSWHATRSMGVELITTTHIRQPIAFSPSVVVMREAVLKSLPERAQRAILETSGEALSMAYIRSMQRAADAAVARVEADPRHSLYTPSEDEQDRFRAAFRQIARGWAAGEPWRRELIDALADVLSEIEATEREAGLDG